MKNLFYFPSGIEPNPKLLLNAVTEYRALIQKGIAPEDARSVLPGYALRQNFVVSFNLRSALHFLDLRSKSDAQAEIQNFSSQLLYHIEDWAPEIGHWYRENRYKKALLAP